MAGYFNELETDVLDMYCAEVPVDVIAQEFGISEELVMQIGSRWDKEHNPYMDFA